jgi:hypothetical protein
MASGPTGSSAKTGTAWGGPRREAPRGAEPDKFPTELVVGQFRNQKGVLVDSPSKPDSDVSVLARVADLPEDSGIEQQLHEPLGRGRSVIGSTPATSQSGSLDTSSASQRLSIAAMRCARSICGNIRARRTSSSELPKRANSSGSTVATAKDRRAFLAYLPRGSHLALEKSTSGISRSERFLVSPAAAAEFDHCRDDLNETRQTYRKQMTSRARRASKARS